jgi:hypothetical protein
MSNSRRSNSSATRYPNETRRDSRPYAADRSPLQKLEGKLDTMSKEEKRARVEEAEHRAQQRLAAKHGQPADPDQKQYRDNRSRHSTTYPESRPPPVQDPTRTRSNRVSANKTSFAPEPSYIPAPRAPPLEDDEAEAYIPTTTAPPDPRPDRNARINIPNDTVPWRDGRRRSEPGVRVLTKPPPPQVTASSGFPSDVPTQGVSLRDARRGEGDSRYAVRPQDGYANPPAAPMRRDYASQNRSSMPQVPPTSTRGFPTAGPVPMPQQEQHHRFNVFRRHDEVPPSTGALPAPGAHHHLPKPFHHDDEDLRRYQPPRYRDVRKDIRVARLALDESEPAPRTDAAWWEKSSNAAGKRRTSGADTAAQGMNYDGGYDAGAQTFFQPPLYLKCGPLLRFTGIRRDPRRLDRAPSGQSDRELWTGSIMIVTVDSKSSNERPPTLRIFKQPIELLPPPPAEVEVGSEQQLPPEYVDPVAGQVKMSRVGKTLYVRPVESLEEHRDLSRVEDDSGLFEETRSAAFGNVNAKASSNSPPIESARPSGKDGGRGRKFQEVPAYVLHSERGVTFWKFNLEIELGNHQARVAYRINRGPAIGFWVPAKGEMMNLMFHSCNGFSLSVDPNTFSGPDPLWRDALNTHQTRPFHAMIGGGDQIYNDAATVQSKYLAEWTQVKNPVKKHHWSFSEEMQNELEQFYLNRYAMWFSQGMFGMATSQIPMINMWDDHDIMDGFGSYPDSTMACPVMSGVGGVAFKYYMLFQHQSLPIEDERQEPSWLLGAEPGPFIQTLSRSLFMFLGRHVALLGLDCRTERTVCNHSLEARHSLTNF